jgi:hypothetical protein
MKKILLMLYMGAIFASCKKNISQGDSLSMPFQLSNRESKIYIAKTLAKAVDKEVSLRSFLKREALKQFDNDYDVFYQAVKNEIVDGQETFDQKILKYASSRDTFDVAVQTVPLLTILVPALPEFNAERWDTSTEVPSIAVEPESKSGQENIKAFYAKGSFDIPHGLIPAKAMLVVKENERIVVNNNAAVNNAPSVNKVTTVAYLNVGGKSYSFADPVFNGLKTKAYNSRPESMLLEKMSALTGPKVVMRPPTRGESDSYVTRRIDISKVQFIVDAFNSGNEWQRDYVYYGINPSAGITSGPVKRNIKECLTHIRFADAEATYGQIGHNPGDPQPQEGHIWQNWTTGTYEFRITAVVNAKNGPGLETMKTMYVYPSQLFSLKYTLIDVPRGVPPEQGTYFYSPSVDGARLYELPDPIPLENWDLENLSFGWNILFSRFNAAQTVTETTTQASEFATNFELSIPAGETIKVGAKFGASAKSTNTQTHTVTKTIGPQDLGSASHYFDTPIWKSYRMEGSTVVYNPTEIFLGTVYLTIQPRLQ